MINNDKPLKSLDQWDDDIARRYPQEAPLFNKDRRLASFRDYTDDTRDGVREFYRQNRSQQTVKFAEVVREKYLPLRRCEMGVWEAMDYLNEMVDDSDPDIELPQIAHALQTAEAIRDAGHPDWFILVGLIHDMGKVLCLFGEPQWSVTGDTFPVGCRFSECVVCHEFFAENPDWSIAEYQTASGIYEVECGLDNVLMSWGHDEYLYHVVRDYVPLEAQYMIRYHSFYPCHREGAYQHLMNDQDREMFQWVRKFNPYDLYTKSDKQPDLDELLPYYRDLTADYFPDRMWW